METFKTKLIKLGAGNEFIKWAESKEFAEAWAECHKATWMLWYMWRAGLFSIKDRLRVTCDCAEKGFDYFPASDGIVKSAIAATRKYIEDGDLEAFNLSASNEWWAAEPTAIWLRALVSSLGTYDETCACAAKSIADWAALGCKKYDDAEKDMADIIRKRLGVIEQ